MNTQSSFAANVRIVFMGTPAFAAPSLLALHEAERTQRWEIVAVVTQPDRPAGRGKRVAISPVKEAALELELPILQPGRLRREPEAVEALRSLAPDVIVVAAYGQILPKEVLEIPRFGCINVHASLLPAYRGASPITAAILDGQDETGVSIMLMDEGMDTGPVLAQARQPIRGDDTTASLGERLAMQGAALLVETLPRWLRGEVTPVDQGELPGTPSVCRLVKKEDGRIDWSRPAAYIERMTRAYTPWPSAFTTWKGALFKIWSADVAAGSAEPGRVLRLDGEVAVGSGDGLLVLRTVQPAGKRAMDIRSFLNGAPDFVGARLGQEA
ncbi:MAG: methionyl-tRNA formyltransferase [Caldilineae bacterium]|nr:MAG: methionyl-tRNA formyltransferase [Caldilineae bacterium]